jgi:arginine/ornithine N-succinyltransferase beta subunit
MLLPINKSRSFPVQNVVKFIFSLFPSGKIYTTFLAAEARNAIGKVGKETEPVLQLRPID